MEALLLELKPCQVSSKSWTTFWTTIYRARIGRLVAILAVSSCAIIAVNIHCTLNDHDFVTVIGDKIFRRDNL